MLGTYHFCDSLVVGGVSWMTYKVWNINNRFVLSLKFQYVQMPSRLSPSDLIFTHSYTLPCLAALTKVIL